jgi:hypothetical protein
MDIITLLELLVNSIFEAEEKFFDDPTDFYSLEKSVKSTTESFAAGFLGKVLSSVNERIKDSSWRNGKYKVQRTDKRTLISSVGDISFDCTYYERQGQEGGYTYLLEDVLGLGKHERFTEEAEVLMLAEALKTSYAEAALVLPSKQKITKTTVMNKVHQIADEMPYETTEERKKADYLFIEADEDHVAEQHGRWNDKVENKSFISKLIYVYESKQESSSCKFKKELVNTYRFAGVYQGADGNAQLWKNVQEFIEKTYDSYHLKKVFISGDGAPWIKSGTDYVDKSVFCADKFHLMKYINIAAAQLHDEKEFVKNELWHLLYSKDNAKKRFDAYTKQMLYSAKNPDKVETLRTYVLGNWAAVRRTLRNKLVNGCSAESHVSHILSDRLSSRPMGWSQTGADRMSKLRCYEKNHGRDKIINLVKYSRAKKRMPCTGTDGAVIEAVSLREIRTEHYNQAKSYIDRLQAHIPGCTARKTLAIRNRLESI